MRLDAGLIADVTRAPPPPPRCQPTRQYANTLGGYAADDDNEIVELMWRLTGFQENFHTFSACADSVKIPAVSVSGSTEPTSAVPAPILFARS
ncbi:hypothetical protein CGCF413_v014244 [Colletotrichum fructicola]|nr:hypothetical protein CGCF413_v014244 [Colletotrichum fructicola]